MAKTFKGGLRCRRRFLPDADAVRTVPDTLTYRIAACRPHPAEGETVVRGSLLAPSTATEAAVLAGEAGRVTSVRADGEAVTVTVTTETDGGTGYRFPPPEVGLSELTAEALAALLRERGIALPSVTVERVKLLVIDTVGDDPFVDTRTFATLQNPDAVIGGARILMKYFSVRRCVLAVTETALAVAHALEGRLPRGERMLRIAVLRDQYPLSEPRLMVNALTRLEIHPSIDPASVGYYVLPVTLCVAVYEALVHGVPYTEAPVTLSNERDGLPPRPVIAPFGSSPAALFRAIGTELSETDAILSGGSYRREAWDAHACTDPQTEALVLPASDTRRFRRLERCIGCGRCQEVCPMQLAPSRLYEARRVKRIFDRYAPENCIGCGCCTVSCPAGLPLAETILAMRGGIE